MTLLGEQDHLPRINIASSNKPHDHIAVEYRWFRWHLLINGRRVMIRWRRNDLVLLANFFARLASPSTLSITPGPGHPAGERREF